MKTQGPIEGVKSKGKALIKVVDVSFKYPRNDKVTIEKATVQVSLSSRVACIGPNGAGKSTLIKCLTGEVQPTTGTVWQHPNARIGYIAQHAFHHIEQRVSRVPSFSRPSTHATFMTLSTRCHLRDGICAMAWRWTARTQTHMYTCIHIHIHVYIYIYVTHRHMDKTPNEYIRWRYAGGEDREAIAKDTMKISDAELELQKTVH